MIYRKRRGLYSVDYIEKVFCQRFLFASHSLFIPFELYAVIYLIAMWARWDMSRNPHLSKSYQSQDRPSEEEDGVVEQNANSLRDQSSNPESKEGVRIADIMAAIESLRERIRSVERTLESTSDPSTRSEVISHNNSKARNESAR